MKAILEFKLPQEQEEYKSAVEGMAWKSAMQDADNRMRSLIKYNSANFSEEVLEGVDIARDILTQVCDERDLTLWT